MDLSDVIGIVPAAGAGARLGGRLAKELLPVALARDEQGRLRPAPVAEHALRALARAGLRRALVVASPAKPELLRVLLDGRELGLDLAYVVQEAPTGLAAAVLAAAPWCAGRDACLVLPDAVFTPPDAPRRVCEELRARGADLVLGVFPTDRPELLGPVRADADGRAREVLEKPARTDLRNTWGLAAWSPRFAEHLARALGPAGRESTAALGHVFDGACRAGLHVRAVTFDGGTYLDAGTPDGLAALLAAPRPLA